MNFRDTLNWLPKRRARRFARTGFAESTLAELMWQRTRNAAARAGFWGAGVGLAIGLVAFTPASWLANRIASATHGTVLLTETRGTVWSGSGMLVLTGGPDSHDASALPGRMSWTLRPSGLGMKLTLSQPCCLNDVALRIQPGLGRLKVTLEQPAAPTNPANAGAIAQWPAAWLNGYGTPFNTLQLGGVLKLASPGFTLESSEGRWHLAGQLDVLLLGVSSSISTLDTLGSYRLSLQGAPDPSSPTMINLSTIEGALQLTGSGQVTGGKVHFRAEARAAEGSEAALNNLLNIIGRRHGAQSVISIG